MEVVNAAAQHIIEYGDTTGIIESESALFKQLIQLIFTQFRAIIRNHVLILNHLQKTLGKDINKFNVRLHDEAYLWVRVQAVVSLLKGCSI